MQKTGWTNYSPFLVWPGVEKGFTLDVITGGWSTTIFLCITLGHFRHGDKQPNKQPGDPNASLLFTSKKAVFCNERRYRLLACNF